MKNIFYFVIALSLIGGGCRKETLEVLVNTNDTLVGRSLTLATVQAWYLKESKLYTNGVASGHHVAAMSLDWAEARSFGAPASNYWLLPLSGQPKLNGVGVGYRKLAFLKDRSGHLQTRFLEIIPDVPYWQRQRRVRTADFTGRIYIYDLNYRFLGGRVYAGGRPVGESKPRSDIQPPKGQLQVQQVAVSTNCQWYDSNYTNAEGELVIHSEKICTTTIYDDGWYPPEFNSSTPAPVDDPLGGGSGSGTGPGTAPPPSDLPGEDQDKIEARDYVRCFSAVPNAGAQMSVTLYVQQPFPGTVFNIGPNSVGHVALGLNKTNGTATVRQTVGFYPDATGPKKVHAPSKLIDNGGGLNYQLSITYSVTASQFQAILDYVNTPPTTYDIVESNCTTFAVNALANGGIMAPDPYSVVGLNGAGGTQSAMTPAGLGNSISQMKGKPGVNVSGGIVPGSKGPCK